MLDSSVNQFIKLSIRRCVATPALGMLTQSINKIAVRRCLLLLAPGNQPTDLTVTLRQARIAGALTVSVVLMKQSSLVNYFNKTTKII